MAGLARQAEAGLAQHPHLDGRVGDVRVLHLRRGLDLDDAVAAADGHLAVAKDVVGKTDAWAEVLVRGGPHAGDRADTGRGYLRRRVAGQVSELRDDAVGFGRRAVPLPAQSEVQRQVFCRLPVVIHEEIRVLHDVVTVGIGHRARSRVDRDFLVIRIVVLEVAGVHVRDVRDKASPVHRSNAARRNAREVGELVIAGRAEIPDAVQDAVLPAAADLDGVLAFGPAEVVLDLPAVLREAVQKAAVADAVADALAEVVAVDVDARHFLGAVASCVDRGVAIVGDGHLVDHCRAEDVRLDK